MTTQHDPDNQKEIAMSDETPVPEPEKKTPKAGGTRGPKPKAVIEAETEARVRAEMEADFAKREAALRAELASQSAPEVDLDARVAEAVAKALATKEEAPADPLVQSLVNPKPPQITADDVQGDPNAEGSVTIHFVADGFTALGKVWYIGEELTLTPGTNEWDQALLNDDTDRVFAQLDEDEQIAKYGERKFREGPWRGRTYDVEDPNLTDEEREVLRRRAEKRLQRTGVPVRN